MRESKKVEAQYETTKPLSDDFRQNRRSNIKEVLMADIDENQEKIIIGEDHSSNA